MGKNDFNDMFDFNRKIIGQMLAFTLLSLFFIFGFITAIIFLIKWVFF